MLRETLTKDEIQTKLQELGIRILSKFIPTEAKSLRDLKLRWNVTVNYKGKNIYTTEYSAGIAYCPSYVQKMSYKMTVNEENIIRHECKHGYKILKMITGCIFSSSEPILPSPTDVLYCLLTDSEAIQYKDFTDWAISFGYRFWVWIFFKRRKK